MKTFKIFTLIISMLSYSTALSKEIGTASFYGTNFQGKIMANGLPFDMRKLTIAHRTLPLGTIVKITNIENGKFVFAKVTDRGPFVKNRIVDVSRACAIELDMIKKGTAKVRIRVIEVTEI